MSLDANNALARLLAHDEVDADALNAHVGVVLDDALTLVQSRALLADFVARVAAAAAAALAAFDGGGGGEARLAAFASVWRCVLERTGGRQVAFEEQIALVRFSLADILEATQDWSDAAKVLMQVPLDSGHRHVDDLTKAQVYVRIVRLLLEDEDSVSAESYLNRASLLINKPEFEALKTTDAFLLTLQFKASQARLLDFKRLFQLAAQKYHQLSYISEMALEERLVCLEQAVVCAILAPAGPGRSRLLATLYKDDRVRESPECATVFYPILEKMYLDRILRASEIDGFRQTLKSHQLAKLSDGTTVLDRAVIEHNILAASKIYTSIRFSELSSLLGVSGPDAAEAVVSRMIGEGRVEGRIDQIEGIVFFFEGRQVDLLGSGIRGVCEQVDVVVENVMEKNADWVSSQLDR
ncbi:PCI domain-containing protein [Obelidium mucronatum]|nr:PCI domain-containing protein [Obelidium mucronatum]